MSVEIALITPEDIPHAITTIQSAFVTDPFNFFIYDRTKLSLARNAASLGIRLRWGITNGYVLVAHTPDRRCASVAMWVPPKPLDEAQTWWEWGQALWLWIQQAGMNAWHGRGGLRVDVHPHLMMF
jgi:GNAT superfamily N-acetyltransferase